MKRTFCIEIDEQGQIMVGEEPQAEEAAEVAPMAAGGEAAPEQSSMRPVKLLDQAFQAIKALVAGGQEPMPASPDDQMAQGFGKPAPVSMMAA